MVRRNASFIWQCKQRNTLTWCLCFEWVLQRIISKSTNVMVIPVHTRTHTHTHARTHARTHTHTNTVRSHTARSHTAYTLARKNARTYARTHTRTHTRTRTQMSMCSYSYCDVCCREGERYSYGDLFHFEVTALHVLALGTKNAPQLKSFAQILWQTPLFSN